MRRYSICYVVRLDIELFLGGILSEALSRLGAKVTGVDANPDIIEVAKKHSMQNNLSINYLFTSIEEHSKENPEKYDAVAASEIIGKQYFVFRLFHRLQ